MTIRPGQPWGEPVVLPDGMPTAANDCEITQLYQQGHRVVGLGGGDLYRMIGGQSRGSQGKAWGFPVDLGWCSSGGERWPFIAHLLLGMRRGIPTTALMNTSCVGDWDLSPRGHPNDGRMELVTLDLPREDRREFRRRVVTGSHLPHPDIEIRSLKTWACDAPEEILLDGVSRRLLSSAIEVDVEADALIVVV